MSLNLGQIVILVPVGKGTKRVLKPVSEILNGVSEVEHT